VPQVEKHQSNARYRPFFREDRDEKLGRPRLADSDRATRRFYHGVSTVGSRAPLEREGTLFDLETEEHWYRYLFNKMEARSLDEFRNNKISFITFNYDRSLEHFIFTSLKHSYGGSDAETAKVLQAIPIVHVYGQLGKYPYIDKDGRHYGGQLTPAVIGRCVAEIKIAHESAPTGTFEKAHEVLEQAEKVFFLGFGYYRINLERLQLDRMPKKTSTFAGTAFGLEEAEKAGVVRLINELSNRKIFALWGEKTLLALRKYAILSD